MNIYASVGMKCSKCGNKFGMVSGSDFCSCGGKLVKDENAPDVITNYVCPNCHSGFGFLVGGDGKTCPNCKYPIK